MQQNTQRPVSSIAYPILIALSISHCLNDLLQSVITATYPLFKEDLTLSFAQIGLITLVYQMSASVFQPVFGLFFVKFAGIITANKPCAGRLTFYSRSCEHSAQFVASKLILF